MKLVTAVLAPDKLDAVAAALAEAEVYRMTVTECRGVIRPGSTPETASPTADNTITQSSCRAPGTTG